jgi:predicted ribosome quality control (RQC) complex YloA/Tae2 family protein
MKSRFTSADVTAMVISLREKYSPITLEVISLLTWLRILGMRVANVYDVSGKTYLLKLSGDNKKVFLLLDSGISFHTTTLYR